MTVTESSFDSGEKGAVSSILQSPRAPIAWLVLAHGAGANMRHAHMQAIADALESVDIATFRFNFPFKEAGGGRVDSQPISVATIAAAIATFKATGAKQPFLVGGHSFGGRMSSHLAAAGPAAGIDGLVYFSFPLHPASKPATERAEHLASIRVPQLFLSGTRDTLAELPLLREVVTGLPRATLHEIDTADHSFKILKRTRKSSVDVYEEAAMTLRNWVSQLDWRG